MKSTLFRYLKRLFEIAEFFALVAFIVIFVASVAFGEDQMRERFGRIASTSHLGAAIMILALRIVLFGVVGFKLRHQIVSLWYDIGREFRKFWET